MNVRLSLTLDIPNSPGPGCGRHHQAAKQRHEADPHDLTGRGSKGRLLCSRDRSRNRLAELPHAINTAADESVQVQRERGGEGEGQAATATVSTRFSMRRRVYFVAG